MTLFKELQSEPAVEIIQNKRAKWIHRMDDTRIPGFYANMHETYGYPVSILKDMVVMVMMFLYIKF
jgi:hypothetical protein